MWKKGQVLLLVLLLALLIPASLQGQADELTRNEPETAVAGLPTDQIIVRFAESANVTAWLTPGANGRLDALSAAAGVNLTYVRPMFGNVHVLKMADREELSTVYALGDNLAALFDVVYAEPDRILTIVDEPGRAATTPKEPAATTYSYLPVIHREATSANDPMFASQWHYVYAAGTSEGINLLEAWKITKGSNNVVVAVVDTGILNHPDLAGRTVPGYDFIDDSFVGNDGDERDSDPSDPGDWINVGECNSGQFIPSSWHGTHVAGTIGAATNNNVGVAGIDWNARILPIRALGKCGGYTSDILDGVRWAAGLPVGGVPANANPADVINMSLGGQGACDSTEQTVYNDVRNAGVTVVVAAGNSNANAGNFSPASCNNVITVASNDRTGDRASYSNYGSVVEVTAPGGETAVLTNGVLSTLNSGTQGPQNHIYEYYQGTSMAAPHVAGVVSLLLAHEPALTPAQILARLQATARPFPAGSGCTTAICGSGIVDAYRALTNTAPPPPPPPPPNPFTNPGFESGSTGWTEYSQNGWNVIVDTGPPAHQGNWLAWLGGDDSEVAYVSQPVAVPTSGSVLAYYHLIESTDACGYDYAEVRINNSAVHQYDLCVSANTGGYVLKTVNLNAYAGQTVTVEIRVTTDSTLWSALLLDDFSFVAAMAPENQTGLGAPAQNLGRRE